METPLVQLPGTIEKIETLADGSISLKLSTQELVPEDAAALFGLKGKLGWFVFKPTQVSHDEIPKEEAPDFQGAKSPGQRLRAVIYRLHEQQHRGKGDFETFYRSSMERLIESIKERLT